MHALSREKAKVHRRAEEDVVVEGLCFDTASPPFLAIAVGAINRSTQSVGHTHRYLWVNM